MSKKFRLREGLPFLASASASPIELFVHFPIITDVFSKDDANCLWRCHDIAFSFIFWPFHSKRCNFLRARGSRRISHISDGILGSMDSELDEYEELSFSSKVQFLVNHVTSCDLMTFLTRLSLMGPALNVYSKARFYILNRLIGRVLEADATILSNVLEKLETWIEDLGELPDLEACYGREMLNLAYDIIHQQSKDVPALNLCSSQ